MKKQIEYVDFGLNLDKYDGERWTDKVAEFKEMVEKNGVARASWWCSGRTRHLTNAKQLKQALPEYDFELDYDSYLCIARK